MSSKTTFVAGDRVQFLRYSDETMTCDVDDEALGTGVVIAVCTAPADGLMRDAYRALHDDPVSKSFLGDSIARIREELLSSRLRGLMWEVVRVRLDSSGVTLEDIPPNALRKIASAEISP